jgi:hypothetical protein
MLSRLLRLFQLVHLSTSCSTHVRAKTLQIGGLLIIVAVVAIVG